MLRRRSLYLPPVKEEKNWSRCLRRCQRCENIQKQAVFGLFRHWRADVRRLVLRAHLRAARRVRRRIPHVRRPRRARSWGRPAKGSHRWRTVGNSSECAVRREHKATDRATPQLHDRWVGLRSNEYRTAQEQGLDGGHSSRGGASAEQVQRGSGARRARARALRLRAAVGACHGDGALRAAAADSSDARIHAPPCRSLRR